MWIRTRGTGRWKCCHHHRRFITALHTLSLYLNICELYIVLGMCLISKLSDACSLTEYRGAGLFQHVPLFSAIWYTSERRSPLYKDPFWTYPGWSLLKSSTLKVDGNTNFTSCSKVLKFVYIKRLPAMTRRFPALKLVTRHVSWLFKSGCQNICLRQS